MARKRINILNSNGKVVPDKIHVKCGKDEVEWVSGTSAGRSTIIFAESPFVDSVFVAPGGGSTSSGLPVRARFRKGEEFKVYKYTVIGSRSANDPIIVVDK